MNFQINFDYIASNWKFLDHCSEGTYKGFKIVCQSVLSAHLPIGHQFCSSFFSKFVHVVKGP